MVPPPGMEDYEGSPDLRLKTTVSANAPAPSPTDFIFPDFGGYAAPTPPGYEHFDEDWRPMCAGILWMLVALSTVAVCGRLYTRYKITRIVGLEDWIMPLALISMVVVTALHQDSMSRGFLGLHIWDIKLRMPEVGDQVLFVIGQSFYNISTATIRIAVLLFVRRLNPYPFFNMFIVLCIIVNVVFPIFAICSLIFRCSPIRAGFEPVLVLEPGVTCLPMERYGKAIMSISLALDLICWLLPVGLVYRVPANWKKKLIMVCIMSLGLLACIAGACRIPATFTVWKSMDLFWDNVRLTIFMQLEMGVGIIAACGPGMKPLLVRGYTRLKSMITGQPASVEHDQKKSHSSNCIVTMEMNPQIIPQSAGRRTTKTFGSSTDQLYMREIENAS